MVINKFFDVETYRENYDTIYSSGKKYISNFGNQQRELGPLQ